MKNESDLVFDIFPGRTLTGAEVFGHPDVCGIDSITFSLDGEKISVSVDPDTDTLIWTTGSVFPHYEGQVRKNPEFWKKYLGKNIVFVWRMANQGGYHDATQFMFGPQETEFMITQIMAMSSGLIQFSLTADGPSGCPETAAD